MAEHKHFLKIDTRLTLDKIRDAIGLDLSVMNTEDRDNPALDMHTIYALAGRSYTKTKLKVQKMVDALDYADLSFVIGDRVPSLKKLANTLLGFFFPDCVCIDGAQP